MTDTPKRFDEWEEVDCNECTHYWDSSCDGVSRGSRIGCNGFLATRNVVIPEKINELKTDILAVKVGYGVCIIMLTIAVLAVRFGWF